MEQRFLNTKEVAKYLGLSEATIRSWIKSYKIPFSKMGRCVRFDITKINLWVKTKECKDVAEDIL
jgi:excisionase family DNA binding protein